MNWRYVRALKARPAAKLLPPPFKVRASRIKNAFRRAKTAGKAFNDLHYIVAARTELLAKIRLKPLMKKVYKSQRRRRRRRLARRKATTVYARNISVHGKVKRVQFDDAAFQTHKLHVKILAESILTSAVIDSGAEVSFISKNVADWVVPLWRDFPDAGSISLKSHTQHTLGVCGTRWFRLQLDADGSRPFDAKLAITDDADNFFLGSDVIMQEQLGLEWHSGRLFLSSRGNKTNSRTKQPVSFVDQFQTVDNIHACSVGPHGTEQIQFQLPAAFRTSCGGVRKSSSRYVVSAMGAQPGRSSAGASLSIIPSLSPTTKDGVISAVVVNKTGRAVKLPPGGLTAACEPIDMDENELVDARSLTDPSIREQASRYLSNLNVTYCRQVIASEVHHAPAAHTAPNTKAAARTVSAVGAANAASTVRPARAASAAPVENSPRGHDELYSTPEDVLDFTQDFSTDIGDPTELPDPDPAGDVDFASVDPLYHGHLRSLLERYPRLLAKHQYDAGAISRTLGYLYLNLVRPLPRSRKVYYAGPTALSQMQSALLFLEKFGHISRAPTCQYGSPVFLIARRNKQAQMRFLCAVQELNSCLETTVTVLPHILRLVENLARNGVGLISVVDLRCAYRALEIYPPHRERAALLTPLGSYISNTAMMGLAHVVSVFQNKVTEAINSVPDTREPDVLACSAAFLDDINTVTPRYPTPEETGYHHYLALDRLFYRLDYHNFRVSPGKLAMFQKSAVILGHIVEEGKVSIDPRRLEKFRAIPIPETRKQVMSWCGFLSSLKHFSPFSLARLHSVLTPLTSPKVEFQILPHHVAACEKIRELVTSHDFTVSFPDPAKPKLIFVDSSLQLAGAILLEFDCELLTVEEPEKVPESCYYFSISDPVRKIVVQEELFLYPTAPTPGDGNCFCTAVCTVLEKMQITSFPTDPAELRTAIIACLDSSPLKADYTQIVQTDNWTWEEFLHTHVQNGCFTDSYGLMVQACARYLEREISLVCVNAQGPKVLTLHGGGRATDKPHIWLALYPDTMHLSDPEQRRPGHFQSLLQFQPNHVSQYTSFATIRDDYKKMTPAETAARVREAVTKPNGPKIPTKVLAYFSKTISKNDRNRPIFELEMMALVACLNDFKPYIANSPAVIACIDSRTAYYLFSPGVNRSSVKTRRYNLLLQAEYPHLVLLLCSSAQNCSDLLSRIFDFPESVLKEINMKDVTIAPVPELDGKLLAPTEIEQLTGNLSNRCIEHRTEGCESSTAERDDDGLFDATCDAGGGATIDSVSLEVLSTFTSPVKILRERLRHENVMLAQKAELPFWDELEKAPNQRLESGVALVDGVVVFQKDGSPDTLYIPPSLEGVAMAYVHLVTGHSSRDKLVSYARSRFFMPHLHSKVTSFARQCQTCSTTNKLTERRMQLGQFELPSNVHEIIFMDLLEGLPKNSLQISDMLIITCALSKAVYTFPLRQKTAAAVLAHLKSFLMYTNLATRTIYSDNASIFREKRLLTFLSSLGIHIAQTTMHSSKSRGLVEAQVKLITILCSQLMLISPSYSFEDIYWLSAVLLNNSHHPSTGNSPASLIFGKNPFDKGPLGADTKRPVRPPLLSPDLQKMVEKLRIVTAARVKTALQFIQKSRDRTAKRYGGRPASSRSLRAGDLVFVKDKRVPTPGTSIKFRPVLYKSPYIVITRRGVTAIVMRLTDSFVTRLHLDNLRKWRPKDEIFGQLPDSVQKIVGRPLSRSSLAQLAREDKLDLLYVDRIQRPVGDLVTRARAQRRNLRGALEDETEIVVEDEDAAAAAAGDFSSPPARRQVRFE